MGWGGGRGRRWCGEPGHRAPPTPTCPFACHPSPRPRGPPRAPPPRPPTQPVHPTLFLPLAKHGGPRLVDDVQAHAACQFVDVGVVDLGDECDRGCPNRVVCRGDGELRGRNDGGDVLTCWKLKVDQIHAAFIWTARLWWVSNMRAVSDAHTGPLRDACQWNMSEPTTATVQPSGTSLGAFSSCCVRHKQGVHTGDAIQTLPRVRRAMGGSDSRVEEEGKMC